MRAFIAITVICAAALPLAGCSSEANKPSGPAEVKAFKGDPSSPKLAEILKRHFAGGAPPTAKAPK